MRQRMRPSGLLVCHEAVNLVEVPQENRASKRFRSHKGCKTSYPALVTTRRCTRMKRVRTCHQRKWPIPMLHLRDLPVGAVHFPHRCVRCGAMPTRTLLLKAGSGVDFILISLAYRASVEVPICGSCLMRRDVAFAFAIAGFFCTNFVFLMGTVIWLVDTPLEIEHSVAIVSVGMILVMWLYRKCMDRYLDAWALGVSAVALFPKERKIRLAFRDEALAREVETSSKGEGMVPEYHRTLS